MGGCAAPFCNNSSKKGYSMKIFPKDPQRRALWERNIQHENGQWTATKHSCLCEVHFSPEMWEEKKGKRKLKSNAIPTIFGFFLKKNITKARMHDEKEQNNSNDTLQLKNIADNPVNVYNIHGEKEQNNSNNTLRSNIVDIPINDISKCKIESDIDIIDFAIGNNTECTIISTCSSDTSKHKKRNEDQNEKYEDVIKKQRLHIIRMRKKIKTMAYLIQSLRQKVNNNKYYKVLHEIFNKDQIAMLCTKNIRAKNWSDKTVQRALQLKVVCGRNGYEEILRQGIPFPSLRTLRRRTEDIKFTPGISEDMFDFSTYKKSL